MHEEATRILSTHPLTARGIERLEQLARERRPRAAGAAAAAAAAPWPDIGDPDFLKRVRAKREIAEALAAGDQGESDFELTRSQRVVAAFMGPSTPYRGLLLFHGTGVGKTCAAVRVAEACAAPGRAAIVIVRPALRPGFLANVFDAARVPVAADQAPDMTRAGERQCTGDAYPRRIRGAPPRTRKELAAKVAEATRARYSLIGPIELANWIAAIERRQGGEDRQVARIRAAFSGRVIVVDEAHLLRSEENRTLLPSLHRIARVCDGVRMLLLTATPAFNDAADVLQLVNLLRANDKLPPLESEDQLRAGAVGYVSHAVAHDPRAFPDRLAPSQIGDPLARAVGGALELCVSAVSREQARAFDALPPDASSTERMQTLNLAFKFTRAFARKGGGGGRAARFAYRSPEFRLEGAGLARHAAKMRAVVDRVCAAKGVCLVYSRFLWAGLAPLAIALEHRGFRRHAAPPLLASGAAPGAAQGAAQGAAREAAPGAAAPAAYVIISGDDEALSPNSMASTLAALKSPHNAGGAVIKVVLISDSGAEGLDLAFVREVHILEPWYNFSKLDQVVGRAIRNGSHALLPPEARNVTVYYHAASVPRARGQAPAADDLMVYQVAAAKRARIERVYEDLRAAAIEPQAPAAKAAAKAPAAAGAKAPAAAGAKAPAAAGAKATRVAVSAQGAVVRLPEHAPPAAPVRTAARALDQSTFDVRRSVAYDRARRRVLSHLATVNAAPRVADIPFGGGVPADAVRVAVDDLAREGAVVEYPQLGRIALVPPQAPYPWSAGALGAPASALTEQERREGWRARPVDARVDLGGPHSSDTRTLARPSAS